MTTDRELLELAAKAAGIKLLPDPHGVLRNCSRKNWKEDAVSNLLATMRQMVEALDWASDLNQAALHHKPLHNALAAGRAAIAEMEKAEPVAWYYVEDPWGANEWHWMTDSPESQGCDPRDWTPVYTAPPAREPLTGFDLATVIANAGAPELNTISGRAVLSLIRAVERAHKIGGDK